MLAVNFFFGVWFWLSPNISNIEPMGRAEVGIAEAKPSPFYLQDDRKRPAVKAMKLRPVVVEVQPEPEIASDALAGFDLMAGAGTAQNSSVPQ